MLHSASQSLAAAALSFLPNDVPAATDDYRKWPAPATEPSLHSLCHKVQSDILDASNPLRSSTLTAVEAVAPSASNSSDKQATALIPRPPSPDVPGPATAPTTPLLLHSLLRYVDNDLVRRRAEWNNPPSTNAICWCCGLVHNEVIFRAAYIPLTCGCWIHYTCFIEHVVTKTPNGRRAGKDCCPICGIRLFILEGIVQLTLATRTNLPMADLEYPRLNHYRDPITGHTIFSDSVSYLTDCTVIDMFIKSRFDELFAPTPPTNRYSGGSPDPSAPAPPIGRHSDGSPDLRSCLYRILENLDRYGYPKSRWLSFHRAPKGESPSSVGFYLFCMLIALKLRGFLIESHSSIVETHGWADFENCREEIQRLISKDVRGAGWSWANQRPSLAAP